MTDKQLPIVLQMRHEDKMWNAYIAFHGHDHIPPIKLGSIAMGAVVRNERCKDAFKKLMMDVMSDLVEEIVGSRPTRFDERPAP